MTSPVYLVAGARPNFIKLAPLVHALSQRGSLPFEIIHTGQHYDDAMSESFFRILDLPQPQVNLDAGSGSQGVQTARILERFERLLLEKPARGVVVFGDVNSTLACSLASVKLQVPVAHVEAGLRSFDRSMPEEINRLVTDSLSDLLLVSEPSGLENLEREGIPANKVRHVGNIMIDSLVRMLPAAEMRQAHTRYCLAPGQYALLTLHRPSNVDAPDTLARLMTTFNEIARRLPVVFPAHPRTRQRLHTMGWLNRMSEKLLVIEPVDYLDSLDLQRQARLVFTDSGGMQEETTYLGVPCLTLRENTERPVTITLGTSTLVGSDPQRIRAAVDSVLSGAYKSGAPIPLWDGRTAHRIAIELESWLH